MEAIPQNTKQFGNKSCCFTSPSQHPGRLAQTMTPDLTRLPDRERCPFHLRKPTSTKYFNQFLKEPKPQSRTPYISKGKGFPCTGQLTQEEGPEEGIWLRILPQSGELWNAIRSGQPQWKETIGCCLWVYTQSEAFCGSWWNMAPSVCLFETPLSSLHGKALMVGEAADDAPGKLTLFILRHFASATLKCSSASGRGFGEAPPTGNSHSKNVPLTGHPNHTSVVLLLTSWVKERFLSCCSGLTGPQGQPKATSWMDDPMSISSWLRDILLQTELVFLRSLFVTFYQQLPQPSVAHTITSGKNKDCFVRSTAVIFL